MSSSTNRATGNGQATGSPPCIGAGDINGLSNLAAEEAREPPGNGAGDLHGFEEDGLKISTRKEATNQILKLNQITEGSSFADVADFDSKDGGPRVDSRGPRAFSVPAQALH